MSDDGWRRERPEDDEDFGPPLFGDVPTTEVRPGDLSFGDADTGSLPHWTEPPTGEIPRVLSNTPSPDPTDDLDVWSSFSSESPVWSDDDPTGGVERDPSQPVPVTRDVTGGQPVWRDETERDPSAPVRRVLLAVDPVEAVVDEAVAWHADLLLTHHPLFLRPVNGVPATSSKGRVVHRLVRSGCGLYAAHTNADVAAPGV
ncbi:MAG: Nif3-like dinuclear metal center hexameric protein, partial [Ilumatobacteraceae bacterium]|nr:Nif3-like dinuclear metal center hexameric protein [Ilumatobacteraceae bacterium]